MAEDHESKPGKGPVDELRDKIRDFIEDLVEAVDDLVQPPMKPAPAKPRRR